MKNLVWLVGIVALSAVAIGASTKDEPDDIDIIMSDVPLTGLKAMNSGEHSANDMGATTVILIGIETCNGTPI